MNSLKELAQSGLYAPEQEHDACGVGMVANIKGEKTHAIITESLEVLNNLGHRGASGSDPDTGDGAGILVQMPDAFFRKETAALGINLPPEGEYGVGMVFLPQNADALTRCVAHIETVVSNEGLTLLGWRDVPLNPAVIGRDAREVRPTIRQFFVGKGAANTPDRAALERKLYVTRKSITNTLPSTGISDEDADFFYICSLSANTVVYKGLLVSYQISGFYLDLNDKALVSAFALVHSRFSTNTLGHWKLAHPLPLPGPQRRDQHPARQHQLDARPRVPVQLAPVRRRHPQAGAHLRPPGQRHRQLRQRPGTAGDDRPRTGPRHAHDDPGSLGPA